MLITTKTILVVSAVAIVLIFLFQIIWCTIVNIFGKERFDPFRGFRRSKRCRRCSRTFKTLIPVGYFGKACPKCKENNDYEVI